MIGENTDSAVLLKISKIGVATVTLNRPKKHNAFDQKTIAELHAAFDQVQNTEQAKVMVLAANGKSFSAGADLAWMKSMAAYSYEANLADARALSAMLTALNTLTKPTIAVVQGAAFGGAVGLICCCDMAVGTNKAAFCLSEVKVGLAPATISPYVVAAMGARAARRYALTAEIMSAEKALNLGLLSQLVEVDALQGSVNALSQQLLSNCSAAMATTKQLIDRVSNSPLNDQLIEYTSETIATTRVSPQAQTRLQQFISSRSK